MPTRLPEYKNRALYTTWDLSYSQLETQYPVAAQLLKLLAYFDNQKLWHGLFQAEQPDGSLVWLNKLWSDVVDFENFMGVLAHYCFVEVKPTTQSYSVHSCVHDWTLAGLNTTVDVLSYTYAISCAAASVDADGWDAVGHIQY